MTTITELAISNLLSFDEKGVRVTLRPLTVLIGANGSGKRNFLQILARSQKHLLPVQDQVWRHQGSDPGTTASVETVLRMSKSSRTIRRRVNYTTNGPWLEPTTNGYRTEDNAAIDSHDANESSRFHEQLFRSRETEVAEQESAAYTLRTLPAKKTSPSSEMGRRGRRTPGQCDTGAAPAPASGRQERTSTVHRNNTVHPAPGGDRERPRPNHDHGASRKRPA